MKKELRDLIDECAGEIDDIESRISSSSKDKSIKYLTYYALIRAAGTAEFVYRSIVFDHFSALGCHQIDKYLESSVMKGSMSAKYEKMRELLGKFDDKWSNDFKAKVEMRDDMDRLIKSSNSLVNIRHGFAHGRIAPVTIADIKQYYQDVVQLISEFDAVINPP